MSDNNKQNSLLKYSYFVFILIFISGITASASGLKKSENEISAFTSNLPFEMEEISLPLFPDKLFDIAQYGAIGDGHTNNTQAFMKTIQACKKAGGGHVVVPPGIWLTGPIELQSNVDLHIQDGAFILFSDRFDDYPLIRTSWEGLETVRCTSPIFARNCENIAITGKGIIDGSGHVWRPVKKFKMTDRQWHELITSGGVLNEQGNIWWPSEKALHGQRLLAELNKRDNVTLDDYADIRPFLRPVMIGFVQCKNVLLDGPTFQNSPAWNIHPLMCENVVVRNINVRNPWYSQNGDGIDLESCKNVVLYHCRFDVGDDAICIKSGKNEDGRLRGMPSENIVISDCIVYHGHGGFTVGSEMSGGVRNISVQNCIFLGTDVGLRFKSTRGRGGIVENIYIENILMHDIPTDAIRFNMYYTYSAPIPDDGSPDQAGSQIKRPLELVNEGTPVFRKIYLKNIICKGANRAVLLQGLPEMPIQEIHLENILITAKRGFTCIDGEQITLKQMKILTDYDRVYTFDNARHVELENIQFSEDKNILIELKGELTEKIHLKNMDVSDIKNKIKMDKSVKTDALISL